MSKQPNWDLIAGIVFDAVGTLIKPVPSVAEAYTEAARRQGVELDARRSGRGSTCISRATRSGGSGGFIRPTRRPRSAMAADRGEVLPEVPDPDRAFDELWDHFGRPESWRCFPDVAPALRALHDAGHRGLRRLEFRRPAPRGRARPARARLGRRRAGHLVGSRLPQTASGVLPGGLRAPGPAAGAGALRGGRPRERRAGCDPRGPLGPCCSTEAAERPRRSAACAGPDGPGRSRGSTEA